MSIKILVLGDTGMAGHMIYNYLDEAGYEMYNLNRDTVDFMVDDIAHIYMKISFVKPDFVINCVGMLNKFANQPENIKEAIYINSYLPHELRDICTDIGAKLIHISTDCVFSGDLSTEFIGDNGMIQTYSNEDISDAKDVYGKTKYLGEVSDKEHVTLRQSIIGPELKPSGIGLLHWFLTQPSGTAINGFTNHYWNGITTLQLAKDIEKFVKGDVNFSGVVNNGMTYYINKCALLITAGLIFKSDVLVTPIEAATPKNAVIASFFKMEDRPSYEGMLEELKEWMVNHRDMYKYNYRIL